MNMISTGAFLNEMDASNKQSTAAEKFAAVWEKKNAKAARAGGVSLMALSLAACGGSSSTTTTTTTTTTSSDLTVNADNLSATGDVTAARAYTPGGNDLVNTLQTDDTITGVAGTAQSLTVTFGNNNDAGAATVAPTISNIETINFNNVSSNAAVDTLDMSNVTGVSAVNVTSLSDDTVIRGMDDVAITMGASNVSDEASDVAFEFDDTAVAGTADAATLTVDNFNGNTIRIGSGADATTNGAGIETLTINATGSASTIASVGTTAATTINVDADANLTISAIAATGVTALNLTGSTATTSINAGANAGTNVFTYTGGAGNDTLILTGDFAGTDSMTGGDGTDHLRMVFTANDTAVGALSAASAAVVSGFEEIELRVNDGTATAITTDMDRFDGATSIDLRTADANAGVTFTLNDVTATQAGDIDLVLAGGAAATDGTVVVDMKTNGTDTVDLDVTASADTQTIVLNDANDNIENANVSIAGAFSTILDVDATSFLTNLTVTGGSSDETLTTNTAFANTTVDMSGVASDITFTAGGTTQTITTGAGDDSITMNTGLKTVDTGAGDDTVVTTVAQLGTAAASWDTIVAGTGTDTLSLSTTTTAVTAEAAANVSGFERLNLTAATGAVTQNMAVFTDSFDRITIGDTANGLVTLTSVAGSFSDLRFSGSDTTNNDTELDLQRLVDSTTNSLTITINGGETIQDIVIDDEETVTITGTGTGTATITDLNANDMTSLTVTGSNAVVASDIDSTLVATVDASAATGAVTVSVASSTVAVTATGNALAGGVFTITTGSGDDTITGGLAADVIVGGAGTDTISGGAGADDITGGDGIDTMTGGAGADEYFYTVTRLAAGDGADIITDFTAGTGGDEIDVDVTGTGTLGAEAIIELAAQETTTAEIADGDIVVVTGGTAIDVSGNTAADLVALNAAIADADAMDAGGESLAVINADTDGDGDADSIQVWYIAGNASSDSAIETAYHIATLSNIAATTDLAGDFVVGNFDLT